VRGTKTGVLTQEQSRALVIGIAPYRTHHPAQPQPLPNVTVVYHTTDLKADYFHLSRVVSDACSLYPAGLTPLTGWGGAFSAMAQAAHLRQAEP
jgi:hypothetical protein